MKRSLRSFLMVLFILSFGLSACNALIAQPQPMPTEQVVQPATVEGEEAPQAEETQSDEEMTDDEAMWADVYAPTPDPSMNRNELAQLSEPELADLIERNVQALVSATEAAIAYISPAIEDNEISSTERDNLYFYCKEVQGLIDLVGGQLEVYNELHSADGTNAARMNTLFNLFQGEVQDSLAVLTDVVVVVETGEEFSPQAPADLRDGLTKVNQVLNKLR